MASTLSPQGCTSVSQYSYTSLKEHLPSSRPEVKSWKDIELKDIELKNPQLQKAAWVYIKMAEPVSNDCRRLRTSRLLNKLLRLLHGIKLSVHSSVRLRRHHPQLS